MATNDSTAPAVKQGGLPPQRVYFMAAGCLLVGLVAGYIVPPLRPKPSTANVPPSATTQPTTASDGGHPPLTLEQMKQMADVQASALIEKSKADPKNASLLAQIASVYQSTHQFKEAAGYYQRALKIEPKNVSARTELASCLYYSGDADGALSQLAQALKYQPADANSLFNLGMIKYRGKNDPKGAIAAWQELLKVHPDLDRKATVEKMIAEAQASLTERK